MITSDGESVFIKDSAVVISVLEDCLKSNQATDLQERLSGLMTPLVDRPRHKCSQGKPVQAIG